MTTNDSAKEVAATAARITTYGRSEDVAWDLLRRSSFRMSQAVPRISVGHTR